MVVIIHEEAVNQFSGMAYFGGVFSEGEVSVRAIDYIPEDPYPIKATAKSQLRGAPDNAKGLLNPRDALLQECCRPGSPRPHANPTKCKFGYLQW